MFYCMQNMYRLRARKYCIKQKCVKLKNVISIPAGRPTTQFWLLVTELREVKITGSSRTPGDLSKIFIILLVMRLLRALNFNTPQMILIILINRESD